MVKKHERTAFLLKKNRQEADLFPSCKRKAWITYAQVVDDLSALEVDVCCSRRGRLSLAVHGCLEAANRLSDPLRKFRRLFGSNTSGAIPKIASRHRLKHPSN
jgi:hypothetical protein